MSDILTIVGELINKAKGYEAKAGSGGPAEAVSHNIPTNAPKADEQDKETNAANSGTHPKGGGAAGSSDRALGGDDFKDGSEDTIGGEGKAQPGRPGTIKHEGSGGKNAGPNHPGTAAGEQRQQKSEGDGDLEKGAPVVSKEIDPPAVRKKATQIDYEKKPQTRYSEENTATGEKKEKRYTLDKEKGEVEVESGGSSKRIPVSKEKELKNASQADQDLLKAEETEAEERDEREEEGEDEKKSLEPGEVYLDIDEFAAEIVSKAVDVLRAEFEPVLSKSEQSEFVEAGLAKSLAATLDRVEELEKAIVNIAKAMNVRKSLLKSSDNIKGIDNPLVKSSGAHMSKSEISSKLLDLQMAGDPSVSQSLVLKYDAVGDIGILPEVVKSKLGIE